MKIAVPRFTPGSLSFSSDTKMRATAPGALRVAAFLYGLVLLNCVHDAISQTFLDGNNPIATTNYGRVRGLTRDIGGGRTVASFIGIPFAGAPTRGNRFRVSFPHRKSSEHNAHRQKSITPSYHHHSPALSQCISFLVIKTFLQEPQPAARWSGDYDATANRVSCLQTEQRFEQVSNNLIIREDEDCLYLNVFVPNVSLTHPCYCR